MDTDGRGEQLMPAETAERIALYLSQQDGVTAATLAALDGSLLASAGTDQPERHAALAAFICDRAEEIPMEGDLRGMGKLVAESEFEQLAIAGPQGEGLVIRLRGAAALLFGSPGQHGPSAAAITAVATRYGRSAGDR